MMEPMTEGITDAAGAHNVRVAYFMSTREFAKEEPMQLDDGTDVTAAHRGSLPGLLDALSIYNKAQGIWRTGPDITIGLIVMDDDAPERDFSDLGIPLQVEPSSAFASVKVPRSASPAERMEALERKAQAKAQYEQRLLDALHAHQIDIVVADRYMRVFNGAFLHEYLGLTLNTHPARLPGLEGKTPTRDAMERALRTGYCFHGNTFHIVDNQIDHGPPLTQEELTPIYPARDTLPMLRRRNRERETPNVCAGLVGYLHDPEVHALMGLHRKLLHANGDGEQALRAMSELRESIIQGYRTLFKLNLEMQRSEPCLEGTYKYNAFMLKDRVIRQRAQMAGPQTVARAQMMRA